MQDMITFAATGDSFITRKLPAKNKSYKEIADIINQADFRFTNLEVTLHQNEGIPGAVSGGTWAIGSPELLSDLKNYGFNTLAWANNHTLDYSIDGLKATEKYLNQSGFVHAGAGQNMAYASEPRYLEAETGRVALISATSTFHESWVAGEQRPDMIGRPGINPLRYNTIHQITSENMNTLKKIASATYINATQELSIKEGFRLRRNDGIYSFGEYLFEESNEEGQSTTPDEQDMKRIIRSIKQAKRQAHYIIVSIHAHEMRKGEKELPAQFLEEFARVCIDEGAHAVIGHGPHVLRGIEIYKNRPIFYSLGNFIFQNDTVPYLPTDFYEKYQLSHTDNVAYALDKRSKNNTIGFGINHKIWESVIPVWTMEKGELIELKLYPVELGYGKDRYERGWPVLSDNQDILLRLAKLSEPYGTKINIEGNIGVIRLNEKITAAKIDRIFL